MYVNKCIKCGAEFETKNPKRVICPSCLYSDKKYTEGLSKELSNSENSSDNKLNSYSFGMERQREERPYRNNDSSERFDRPQYRQNPRYTGNGNRPRENRSFNHNQEGFQRPYNKFRNEHQQGGQAGQRYRNNFNRPGGGFNKPRGGQRPRPNKQKQLLVSKEQIEQIEILYKKALPLPNPDIHEIIGQAIDLEPRKVFFGINLVRQKLMLPKLPFPKRKLAVSADQLFAIKNLYEPLLPLPPIGCHKIIAAQLRMDEWRVHVGIGLIRKQMGLDRWNQDREDAPAEYKKSEQL